MDIELALLQACGHGTRIFGTAHGSNANTSTGTWLLATEASILGIAHGSNCTPTTIVRALTVEVGRHPDDEPRLLEVTSGLLGELVAHDDWLPPEFAKPHPDRYQQYLLHCDPLERFSVVSFVWGPVTSRRSTTTRCGA